MKREYYILKMTNGCFGCIGSTSRVREGKEILYFSNKKDAIKLKNQLNKEAGRGDIYVVDFDFV